MEHPITATASFAQFNLSANLLKGLAEMGYATPTPIQAKVIPFVQSGKDLIGSAQTGTGKTGAFCIPLFESLTKDRESLALVLVPTRELAQQIELFWKKFSRYLPDMKCAMLMGGASMYPQIQALQRRPRLIVATPGRLIDHLERRTLNLSKVKTLILDEADRMLDMGFAPQLKFIVRALPQQRQTLLFSATWSNEVDKLSRAYLKNPEKIVVGPVNQAATKIEQSMVTTTAQNKNSALLDEVNKCNGPILVFVRTQARTDRVAKYLHQYGLPVNRIHGGRSQGQRRMALQDFRNGRTRILVATDIASRGIDVSGISQVINYDLPQVAEDYIHRIGRTARAGASGKAVSLVTSEDKGNWNSILRMLKQSGSSMPSNFAQKQEPRVQNKTAEIKPMPPRSQEHRRGHGGGERKFSNHRRY